MLTFCDANGIIVLQKMLPKTIGLEVNPIEVMGTSFFGTGSFVILEENEYTIEIRTL